MPLLENLVSAYGLLSLSHLFFQISLAHAEYLSNRKRVFNPSYTPPISIVVPTYNEDAPALIACVESCAYQTYAGKFRVLVVNDGSKHRAGFDAAMEKLQHLPHVTFLDVKQNRGKRHAQKTGFDHVDNDDEIMVTIDSDTILEPKTIANLVQKFQDPTVGAVTGDVRAIKTKKLLSQLIAGRYWTAFNQERAAQSLFGTVLCCSGPLAAYRNSVVKVIKDNYVTQRFLGQHCTYGDDRHLTNLVLEKGYKVHFEPRSRAWTHVPTSMHEYLRQQTRWNKSFYRELWWTMRMVAKDPKKLHPYIMYDLGIQTILPVLFILSLILAIHRSITISPLYLVGYLSVMVGIALIRTMYGYYRTRDTNLLKFPLYSFIYVFLLIPTRIYAVLTLKTTHWGTR